VNDYKKFVEDDKFSAKGFDKLVTIVDDVDNPNALLKGAFKADTTAKQKEIQVKYGMNRLATNRNSYFFTGQHYMTVDAVEDAAMGEERRIAPVMCAQTMAGASEYFAYHYGLYYRATPLIHKCILEFFRTYPGVQTSNELQKMAKLSDTEWAGQVPMMAAFLQALCRAPRLEDAALRAAKEESLLSGGEFTLLKGVGKSWRWVTRKAFKEAADAFAGAVLMGVDGLSREKRRVRRAENAEIIVMQILQEVEHGDAAEWRELHRKTKPDNDTKGTENTPCFSVEQKKLAAALKRAGYAAGGALESDAVPSWPPVLH
jgi:hypothetical protein